MENHDNHSHNGENKGGGILRWVLIGVMLIALFFLSLGIVKFIPKALSTASAFLSGVFSSNPKIEISLSSKEIKSDDVFTINWKNNTEEKEGSYFFSYQCEQGIRLYEARGGKPIVCETAFPLGPIDGSIPVRVVSEKTEKFSVPFNISLFKEGAESPTLTNSTSISVIPRGQNNSSGIFNPSNNNQVATSTGSGTSVVGTNQSTSQTSTTGSQTSTYYPQGGKSDLAISLVKRGAIDSNTNFREGSTVNSGEKMFMQFNVSNEGTAPSGAWALSGVLPSNIPSDRNLSKRQPSLNPGDSYLLTLVLNSFDPSYKTANLYIVSSSDSNQTNNQLTVSFDGSSSGGTNYSGDLPDLSVRITDIGTVDRNNRFYHTNSLSDDDTIAVKFEVQNVGGRATGSWKFRVEMPTDEDNIFTSFAKASLAPGEKTNFTITFDNANSGSQEISIEADYNDSIRELNESNNTDSEDLDIDN